MRKILSLLIAAALVSAYSKAFSKACCQSVSAGNSNPFSASRIACTLSRSAATSATAFSA